MLTQRNRTILAVYVAGFISGLALIMYAAGGSLYQDPDFHNLSSSQFGSIFILQTLMAAISSLSTAVVARRFGTKAALLFGQTLIVAAMVLLAGSQLALGSGLAYVLLLVSCGILGFGFGMSLSALTAYSYDLFLGKEAATVTIMHTIIGLGFVVGAPIMGQFIVADLWWGAPTLMGGLMGLMVLFQFGLPLKLSSEMSVDIQLTKVSLNFRLIVYALLVVLYGASEATFSNWSTTYLDINKGFSTSEAALGLSVFWLCIATGRIVFVTVVSRIKNMKRLYLLSPMLVALSFLLLPQASTPILAYLAMGIAGLSLSFFFPYTISLASAENPTQTAFVSGVLVASVQFGIGGSAITVGSLNDTGAFDLSLLLMLSALYGIVMAVAVIYLQIDEKTSGSVAAPASVDIYTKGAS